MELEAGGSGARITELLPIALRFAEGPALRGLRRESAERLQAAGDLAGALEQYTALFCLTPDDRELEQRLRQLAESAGNPASLAEALRAAAKACPVNDRRVELLVGAASVFDRQQGDRAQAVALLEQAMAEEAGAAALRVQALRRLEELYAELGNEPRRLHTLERLATIEPGAAEQRLVWARAAERAAELGETDRALAAWGARLLRDPSDAEALAASARLLAAAERWPDLIDLLHRRIATQPAPQQIRADLVEIATLARDRLADSPRAIETWREVSKRFGDDAQTVDALAELYAAAGRFDDLAELLGRTAGPRPPSPRGHAGPPGRYPARASGPARAGHRLLRPRPGRRSRAGTGPRRSVRVAGGQAVGGAGRPAAGPRGGAHRFLCSCCWTWFPTVWPAAPSRRGGCACCRRRRRWPSGTPRTLPGRFSGCARRCRCRRTTSACSTSCCAWRRPPETSPRRRRRWARPSPPDRPPWCWRSCTEQRARLLDERLGDLAAARDGYAACLALAPHRLDLRQSLIRTAARVGSWNDAAGALVDPIVAPAARDSTLFPLYQSLATELEGYPAAAEALAQALSRAQTLEPEVSRDLELRLVRLWLDRCSDHAGAERALGRALAWTPTTAPACCSQPSCNAGTRIGRCVTPWSGWRASPRTTSISCARPPRWRWRAWATTPWPTTSSAACGSRPHGCCAGGHPRPARSIRASAAEYALERAVERHTADGTPRACGGRSPCWTRRPRCPSRTTSDGAGCGGGRS